MRNLLLPLLLATTVTSASAASVTLQNGQTGTLGDQKIIVLSVKDSRCPMNARCVQAGDLQVTVLVSKNNRLQLLKLKYPPQNDAPVAGLHISGASENMAGSKTPIRVTFSDQP